MKILILHNTYQSSGGEDQVCRSEAKLLSDHGHDVSVVTFDNKGISSVRSKLKAFIRLFGGDGLRSSLRKILDEVSPDVVHVHNYLPLITPFIFQESKAAGIPVVFTLHNYRLVCPGALLLRSGLVCEECVDKRLSFKGIASGCYRNSSFDTAVVAFSTYQHHLIGTWKDCVDRYIVLTGFAKRIFHESALKIPDDKLVVKPNFVTDAGGSDRRSDVFLFVGRISKEKGVFVLLDAFLGSGHKVDIVGTGPDLEELRKRAQADANISIFGGMSREFVLNKMKTCRALVFPSIWYEGLPMTIIEAFSCGCPVIASDMGAMQAVIENGVSGLLFKPGDSVDLASKLNHVTEEMSVNARKEYIANFTPDQNYRQLISIYTGVMNCKN